MSLPTRRILGIDPGTNILGFAIIEVVNKEMKVLKIDVLKMKHLDEHAEKLAEIFNSLSAVIAHWQPTEMALESPFFANQNPQVLLKLGRAQGVAMAAGIAAGLSIAEYLPLKVKQSVTGKGRASKEQVAGMLELTFKLKLTREYLDATDALAVAVCHFYQTQHSIDGKASKFKDWKDFISKKK